MKKPLFATTLVLAMSIVFFSCEKQNNFKPIAPDNYEFNGEMVDLVVDNQFQNNKADQPLSLETESYQFPVDNHEGILEISLSEEATLAGARMSRDVYEILIERYGGKEVNSLPQELLNQSTQLRKLGYKYWENSNFLPPMSKEEFDKRFEKCTGNPTTAGVILCTLNVLTTAIVDCMNAWGGPNQKIHCW